MNHVIARPVAISDDGHDMLNFYSERESISSILRSLGKQIKLTEPVIGWDYTLLSIFVHSPVRAHRRPYHNPKLGDEGRQYRQVLYDISRYSFYRPDGWLHPPVCTVKVSIIASRIYLCPAQHRLDISPPNSQDLGIYIIDVNNVGDRGFMCKGP
jgi:hypothetical protein